jgi:hypothetical protein
MPQLDIVKKFIFRGNLLVTFEVIDHLCDKTIRQSIKLDGSAGGRPPKMKMASIDCRLIY